MALESPIEGPRMVPTKPGILFVNSKSINTSVLDPMDFSDWYENTHIPEMHQTGGFSETQRYESLDFAAKNRGLDASNIPQTKSPSDYASLTIYHMPSLSFRGSKEFASLSKIATPDDETLVEKLFKQAEFYSRFCELQSIDWPDDGAKPTPYIATLTSSSSKEAADLATQITKFSGCKRTSRYQVHEGSVLNAGKRLFIPAKSELFIFEFADLESLTGVLKKLPERDGGDDVQIDLWALRRGYSGDERTSAKWKPRK